MADKIDSSGEDFLKSYVTPDGEMESEEVKLPSGRKVRIRALSRDEALEIRKIGDDKKLSIKELEQLMCSMALVEPKMTVKQVERWQAISPAGDIQEASNKIAELSGMDIKRAKADGTEDIITATKSSIS